MMRGVKKRIISSTMALITVLSQLVLPAQIAFATTQPVYDVPTDGKITICHRTNSVTNPYVQQTISVDAADGLSSNSGNGANADHYGEHKGSVFDINADPVVAYPTPRNGDQWGDIIPPVLPGSNVAGANTGGLNWNEAGKAIYYNDCNLPSKPQQVTAVNGTFTDSCGPTFNAAFVETPTTGVTYVQSRTGNVITVTATAQSGYTLSNPTWTQSYTDKLTACPANDKLVTPADGVFADKCGDSFNLTFTPAVTEGVTYIQVRTGNTIKVTASANPGYALTNPDWFQIKTDELKACPVVVPCVETSTITVTKAEQFADYQETKSKGHYAFTKDGLRIYTDDNSSDAKVAWYHNVNYSLSQIGVPAMDYTAKTGIAPGMQIVVDFDNDGSSDGILVGEAVYGNDWWLSNGSKQFVKDNAPSHAGGYGSANHGTLDQWLANFPDAKVKAVGFSLGSGVLADGVLKSLTFGCVKYEFKKPITPCAVTSATYDKPWTYNGSTFPEADKDGGSVPGTFNFEPTGLYLNTPAQESYVYGMFDGGNTPLSDVDAMSYKTLRLPKSAGYEGTLPAYILQVDTNGPSAAGGMTYFFYEPYNTDAIRAANEGTWQSWDALNGGAGKWWMSGTNQAIKSWSDFVNMYPQGTVVAFGFNQGTYNAETYSAVQDIVFDCATVHFTNKETGGNGGTGETPVTPVTPTTPTVPAAPVVSVGRQGSVLPAELPMTGANGSIVSTWVTLLAAVLTYGAVYYLQPKRRAED